MSDGDNPSLADLSPFAPLPDVAGDVEVALKSADMLPGFDKINLMGPEQACKVLASAYRSLLLTREEELAKMREALDRSQNRVSDFQRCFNLCTMNTEVSVSMFQRKINLSYIESSVLMDALVKMGIIEEYKPGGSNVQKVLKQSSEIAATMRILFRAKLTTNDRAGT